MQITNDTYVVLWSPHQRQFHIETVAVMLKTNLRIYANGTLGDYILLSFASDHDEAGRIADELRDLHKNQDDPGDDE